MPLDEGSLPQVCAIADVISLAQTVAPRHHGVAYFTNNRRPRMARISRALRQIKDKGAQRIPASAVDPIGRDVPYPYRQRKGATW